ncbi:hypothetical protein ACU6YR_11905 [Klebsiella aerogenes]
MSVQSPGCPGLCCFCNISPAALRLDGLLVVRPVGFPAALRLAGLLVVVRPVGFPAALRLAGLLVVVRPVGFPAALRLDWLLVVVRPAGFPAALRLAGLLAGGASCGMSSPGEAFMPTPGRFTGARCEKSPYLRTSSHLEYGGEGGIDSLRSPLWGSPLTAFAVCPTGCASCRTPVGGSHPPVRRI